MSTHTCPGPDCKAQVPHSMLMCARHWRQVPRPVQNRLWAAWQDGNGAGTDEHIAACDAAIAAIGGSPHD